MMKVKVGLETVVSVLPETVVKAEDQAYLEPTIPEMMRGIFKFPDEVRRLINNDAAEILAERAAKKALEKAGLKPSDIDYIIANNSGGKYPAPLVGAYVHHKLGFPQETPVLNIQNLCASFVEACEVAWNYVLAGKYKRILIVTVAALNTSGGGGRSDLTDFIFAVAGDGAGAAIVSSENLKCEFLSYHSRTFGEIYEMCGAVVRSPLHPGLKGAPEQPAVSVYTFGTPEFFDWWQAVGERFGIDGINGALKKANLTISDIDIVIFHQPTDLLYDAWMEGAAKAGLSKDKWKHTWYKYGNMGPAVIPVNLAEFWEAGELKKNSIMAWITIGAGGHAPAMIVKWLA
jgi:3-oxoacyl-[acyl-carrier-protein] synthase-3